MTRNQKNRNLVNRVFHRSNGVIELDEHTAEVLRRAELTLHRWFDLECGDGNQHGSWAIERDDNGDGLPFMVHYHLQRGLGQDYVTRTRIPDREAGARRRVESVCVALGLFYYIQPDPRGCSLYIAAEPLDMSNYSIVGIGCYGE